MEKVVAMQLLRDFFNKNRTFMGFIIVFIAATALPSLLLPREDSFYALNFFHSKMLDAFFIVYTYAGDGVFSILFVIVLLCFKNRLLAFRVFVAFVVSGIMAQTLKKIVHLPRPMALLGTKSYHHFIEGVTHSGYNSFPSGHTTSAFALALLCCLHIKNFGVRLFLFFLACTVGYSRIYLGQHFLPDVFAGMLIGCGTAVVVYLFVNIPVITKMQHQLPEAGSVPA